MASCKIICLHCHQEFDSPIQFRGAESFFTGTLIGNMVQCRKCGRDTGCNKENMKYVSEDAKEDEPVDDGEGRS